MDARIKKEVLAQQRSEITEYHTYSKLASKHTGKNKKILQQIADTERKHYDLCKKVTGQDVAPRRFHVFFYLFLARLFGMGFAIKLMERGERTSQAFYDRVKDDFPAAQTIMNDEQVHEKQLINLIDEDSLKYTGSIVLGLNDALVELTGALAGFTFALPNAALIGAAGLVTGIAASMSMAASEYLSTKEEQDDKHPGKAATYTGIAYFFTVILLVLPFLLLSAPFISLAITLGTAVIIIAVFNFYSSVINDVAFIPRFLEMCAISLGVATVSFFVGFGVKMFLGV